MSVRSPPLSPKNTRQDSSKANSHARNPVSLRLYKVLGTNFNDEATKEALRTLSDLYSSQTAASSLKGKEVQREADDLYDDDDDAEDDGPLSKAAVNSNTSGTSTFVELVPGESAAKARKNLRRDMENKLAEGSRQFLKAFGEVDQVSHVVVYLLARN